MSVRITPCYRCPLREGCELRDEFRARARTAQAAAIRFKCQKIAAAMKPGTRILIDQPVAGDDCDDERGPQVYHAQMKATITASDGYRFACTVDEHELIDERKYRFRKMRPAYRIIRFLDEAPNQLCRCGNVVVDGNCETLARAEPVEKCEVIDFDAYAMLP